MKKLLEIKNSVLDQLIDAMEGMEDPLIPKKKNKEDDKKEPKKGSVTILSVKAPKEE